MGCGDVGWVCRGEEGVVGIYDGCVLCRGEEGVVGI